MTLYEQKNELGQSEYLLNTKQSGKALELLANLENNSVSLVFSDPQYEPARTSFTDWLSFIFGATTRENKLVVDPCAGSFIVLEICQELKRDYLGCDLTYEEMEEFMGKK